MKSTTYRVGQELWRHDVNHDRRGGPRRVKVTKIGRTLVTVVGLEFYAHPEAFRMDTGVINDGYGHAHLCTDEQHEEHTQRAQALDRMKAHGLRLDGPVRGVSTDTLRAIADLLENGERSEP